MKTFILLLTFGIPTHYTNGVPFNPQDIAYFTICDENLDTKQRSCYLTKHPGHCFEYKSEQAGEKHRYTLRFFDTYSNTQSIEGVTDLVLVDTGNALCPSYYSLTHL